MDETPQTAEGLKSPIKETPLLVPIGDVILGWVDPRTLSPDEFERSLDLLFHGTADPAFAFSQEFDYKSFVRPVSATIGEGFYLTDNRREAKIYSQVRQGSSTAPPVVITFLP